MNKEIYDFIEKHTDLSTDPLIDTEFWGNPLSMQDFIEAFQDYNKSKNYRFFQNGACNKTNLSYVSFRQEVDRYKKRGNFAVYHIVNNGGHKGVNINEFTSCFLDIDIKGGGGVDKSGKKIKEHPLPYEELKEAKKWFLNSLLSMVEEEDIPKPSILLHSRNGFHIYWLFKNREEWDIKKWKEKQYQIISLFKIKSTHSNVKIDEGASIDSARILSIPEFEHPKEGALFINKAYGEKEAYSYEELNKYFNEEVSDDLLIHRSKTTVVKDNIEEWSSGDIYLTRTKINNVSHSEHKYRASTILRRDGNNYRGNCPWCQEKGEDPEGDDISFDYTKVVDNNPYAWSMFKCWNCLSSGIAYNNKGDSDEYRWEAVQKAIKEGLPYSELSAAQKSTWDWYVKEHNIPGNPEDNFKETDFFKVVYSLDKQDCEEFEEEDDDKYNSLYKNFREYRAFPKHIFEDRLNECFKQVSLAGDCDINTLYGPFLISIAMAIGSRALLKARGRSVDAKFWHFTNAWSSGGKGFAALLFFIGYFGEKEKEYTQNYLEELNTYEHAKAQYNADFDKYKKNPSKFQRPEPIVVPTRKDLAFEWCTIEAAYRVIEKNPDRILLFVNEFFPWFSNIAKYNNASSAAAFAELQSFFDKNFNENIKQKRRKEEDNLWIDKHYLCMALQCQPDLISRTIFSENLIFSGFVHRFLFFNAIEKCSSDYEKPKREVEDIPKDAKDYFYNIFDTIIDMDLIEGCYNFENDILHTSIFIDGEHQDKEVVDAHYEYFCELDKIEKDLDYPNAVCSNIGRHKMHFLKMILILHFLDVALNEGDIKKIRVKTILNARDLSKYHISHFLWLYDKHISSGSKKKEAKIIEQSEYDRILDYVNKFEYRTLTQIRSGAKINTSQIKKILEQLEASGIGAIVKSTDGKNKGKIIGFKKEHLQSD